jgi:hypothetical protein
MTTQTVSVTDSSSTACAIANYCGLYTYSVTDTPSGDVFTLNSTELMISSDGVLLVKTTNAATVGSHTVVVVAKLESYSFIQVQKTFTLLVT